MGPEDESAEMAALEAMGNQMRRGRHSSGLSPKEKEILMMILCPEDMETEEEPEVAIVVEAEPGFGPDTNI